MVSEEHTDTHAHQVIPPYLYKFYSVCRGFPINRRLHTCVNTVHLPLIIAASSVSPLHTGDRWCSGTQSIFSHTCASVNPAGISQPASPRRCHKSLKRLCFFLEPLQSERATAGEVTTYGTGPESEKSPERGP